MRQTFADRAFGLLNQCGSAWDVELPKKTARHCEGQRLFRAARGPIAHAIPSSAGRTARSSVAPRNSPGPKQRASLTGARVAVKSLADATGLFITWARTEQSSRQLVLGGVFLTSRRAQPRFAETSSGALGTRHSCHGENLLRSTRTVLAADDVARAQRISSSCRARLCPAATEVAGFAKPRRSMARP